jgi:ParB-like chromosome segregation protein Spo0J
MDIIKTPISEITPYVNNSRTHSDEQVAQIAASIKEFGFTNPILIDKDNTIIAGHGRLLAARKLKMDTVPCVMLSGLTKTQIKAYVIADNKLALNAGWDDTLLALELGELKELDFDISLTGFDLGELDILLYGVDFPPATEDEQGQLDQLDPKMVNCPHCSKDFDSRGRDIG